MKPLFVLLLSFIISIIVLKIIKKKYDFVLSARIAMSCMLFFTAIGHFAFAKGMAMMVPEFIPFKIPIVYATGLFEILLAIGLLISNLKVLCGWLLLVFLLSMLPANIYATINTVNYQKATFDGPGILYLWFRVPLQMFFILWVYCCALRLS